MKHSLTAVLAIVSAAGLAGIAQAQTTAPSAATPAPGAEGTAPSTQSQSQSSAAPAAPSSTQAAAPTTAPQANMQQSSANGFWSRNLSQDEVRQAQQQLAAQGLYRGPVDGLAGAEMQRALIRFQQQNGLRQTATLDQDTMNRLMANNAPATAPGVGTSAPPSGRATGPAVGTSAPPASTTAPTGAGGSTTTAPAAPTTTEGQPATR